MSRAVQLGQCILRGSVQPKHDDVLQCSLTLTETAAVQNMTSI